MELQRNEKTTFSLPAYGVLVVTAPANTSGVLVQMGDKAGDPDQETITISASSTVRRGPFNRATWWRLINGPSASPITYTGEPVDLRGLGAFLPTSDPAIAGQLWSSSGAVRVSAG